MLKLTKKASGKLPAAGKSPPAFGCLSLIAIAATMLFTIHSNSQVEAVEVTEFAAIQSTTELVDSSAVGDDATAHDDAAAHYDVAALLEYRMGGASRSDIRAIVPDENDDAETLNLVTAAEIQPVLVTPAPIWCSFTGLTNLPETHELCTDPSHNTPDQNRALGEYLAAQRGWTGNQWQCLDNLMTRESRWRHTAANPVSTARGIPQKMMSVHYGANWRTSATAAAWLNDPESQIEWGLNYIQNRYQTPCGAWGFFQRNGWY